MIDRLRGRFAPPPAQDVPVLHGLCLEVAEAILAQHPQGINDASELLLFRKAMADAEWYRFLRSVDVQLSGAAVNGQARGR